MNVDGLLDIRVEGASVRDTDAEELLAGLQIHHFLKFTQTRSSDKIPVMFCEKVICNTVKS
jgi:hypothetical protein